MIMMYNLVILAVLPSVSLDIHMELVNVFATTKLTCVMETMPYLTHSTIQYTTTVQNVVR